MKTISILGSGWLGLPLARHFLMAGNHVKASTTSDSRLAELAAVGVEPFVVNIDVPSDDIQEFLQANILIVNIPSKNVAGFRSLIARIETSEIENILFVSSTSVYQNVNRTISETDDHLYSDSPLLEIEEMFLRGGGKGATIVRFGGLIGYGRHPGRFFRSGKVVQNPDTPVNLIHRDDCIAIISRIVERKAWGEVFNCCADTHPSKRAFYTRAVELIGGDLPEFGASDPGSGKVISNRKVKRCLDYEFIHPDLMQLEFEESS